MKKKREGDSKAGPSQPVQNTVTAPGNDKPGPSGRFNQAKPGTQNEPQRPGWQDKNNQGKPNEPQRPGWQDKNNQGKPNEPQRPGWQDKNNQGKPNEPKHQGWQDKNNQGKPGGQFGGSQNESLNKPSRWQDMKSGWQQEQDKNKHQQQWQQDQDKNKSQHAQMWQKQDTSQTTKWQQDQIKTVVSYKS
jgi:hypothetical protein